MSENNKNSKGSVLASEKKKRKKKTAAIIALSITTGVLALSTVGLGIGLGISEHNSMNYKTDLENVYNNNFYNLLDSVNNLENKLSKTLSSSRGSTYQRKMLLEASKNASEAEISVSQLPLSQSEIQDTIKLVNQISGYTSTLATKMAEGHKLTESEMSTLEKIHYSVLDLKQQLNDFEKRLNGGYSILDGSLDIDEGTNEFTRSITSLKNNNIEYPSMIYDGPFSDSVVNSKVKGLQGKTVSKEEASNNLEKTFKNGAEIAYEGETNGRFETYNFRVTNTDGEKLFVQVTKIGGHILTISGVGENGESAVEKDDAKEIALKFASDNGIEDGEIVWSDSIENDFYLNIAPKSNGIILYPDLVKVKVNLTSGTIVGYDATTYFTNHISRTLSKGSLSLDDAVGRVPSTFEIVQKRLVLSPLDYNREVVCVEVEADSKGSTYYFYFNAESGELENVLKVINTDDGSLLM